MFLVSPVAQSLLGPSLMASLEAGDTNAYDNEKPQHRIELPSCRIGLYPMISAQCRHFAEGAGCEDPR